MKPDWFNNLNVKLQLLVKVVGAIAFLSPFLLAGIKTIKPYYGFIIEGPQLVKDVRELKRSLFVLTGVTGANLVDDSSKYKATWRNQEIIGRIKTTESGNKYVFLPDKDIGERTFIVNYNYDQRHYFFIDFDGNYIILEKE